MKNFHRDGAFMGFFHRDGGFPGFLMAGSPEASIQKKTTQKISL
jgi:hypothetical protein